MNVSIDHLYKREHPGTYLVTPRGVAVAHFANLYDAMDEAQRRYLNSGGDNDLTITTIPTFPPTERSSDA